MSQPLEYLGRLHVRWNLKRVSRCEYVYDGQVVLAYHDGKVHEVTVSCACGHHARVEIDGVSHWFNVNDLAISKAANSESKK